jgi:hypothetical protein
MIVTIHQPNYLPYLGFFDKMQESDIFILYDNTQYKSEDFQNRNRIRTAKGWQWLTIPVTYTFGDQIKDVKIIDQHWRKTHWKSIEANYSRAPHFNDYKKLFKEIYDKEWTSLAEFNIAIITAITKAMGIRTKLVRASELIPDMPSKSTDALIELCQKVGATKYISGADGEKYLDINKFKTVGIEVEFQHYKHPEYKQVFQGFEPYMSAIDLLFN